MTRAGRPSVVLLDLDGTLTDSAPGILACIRYALDHLGVEAPGDDVMRGYLGPPLSETFGVHFGMSDADVERAIDRYRERYHDVGLFENEVYPGVPAMLDTLGSAATLAVATSKPTVSATRILEHFGLAGRFAFIGGAELDGSRQHKADVIAHTLDALAAQGVPDPGAAATMVGDRAHDVRGAAAHGIPAVGVLWGYGDADELLGAGAVAVVEHPADLPDQVRRGRAPRGS